MKANKSRITHAIIYQVLTWWHILLPDGENLFVNAVLIGKATPEKPYLSDDTRILQNVFHKFNKAIGKMT